MPPTITLEQAKGFSLFMVKAVLGGRGDEIMDRVPARRDREPFHHNYTEEKRDQSTIQLDGTRAKEIFECHPQ